MVAMISSIICCRYKPLFSLTALHTILYHHADFDGLVHYFVKTGFIPDSGVEDHFSGGGAAGITLCAAAELW